MQNNGSILRSKVCLYRDTLFFSFIGGDSYWPSVYTN